MNKRQSLDFKNKRNEIVVKAELFHDKYYDNLTFKGPSLYFYKKTFACIQRNEYSERCYELIYSTLVAWGMHRIGPKGPKVVHFNNFLENLSKHDAEISSIKKLSIDDLMNSDSQSWLVVKKFFENIKIMDSGSSLVGNSKVMANLFPDLFAPIDRTYTLTFLYGSTYISASVKNQWELFKKIHREFYYPLVNNPKIKDLIITWNSDCDKYQWDTSPIKTIDNLVIGSVIKSKNWIVLPVDFGKLKDNNQSLNSTATEEMVEEDIYKALEFDIKKISSFKMHCNILVFLDVPQNEFNTHYKVSIGNILLKYKNQKDIYLCFNDIFEGINKDSNNNSKINFKNYQIIKVDTLINHSEITKNSDYIIESGKINFDEQFFVKIKQLLSHIYEDEVILFNEVNNKKNDILNVFFEKYKIENLCED